MNESIVIGSISSFLNYIVGDNIAVYIIMILGGAIHLIYKIYYVPRDKSRT